MGKVAVAVIVSLWVISVSTLVNRMVPEPYMDEIFHIPQAQQYCIGNFSSWDPMITTPPGLWGRVYPWFTPQGLSRRPGLDVASLTAVLAMYLACLKKSYWCSAVLGALAVVIQQTNIVWMLFVACTGVINITLVRPRDSVEENNIGTAIRKTNRSTSNDNVTSNSNLRRRKFSNALGTDKQSMPSASFFSVKHSSGLLDEVGVILIAL